MLKIIGACIIIFASASIGRAGAARMEKRFHALQYLQNAILSLEREINYAVTPLPQALLGASSVAGPLGILFELTAQKLLAGRGINAQEAWTEAMEETELPLNQSDHDMLIVFAAGLGLSDRKDQLKRLELIRLRLQAAEEEAKREWQSMGKVWKNLGLASGIVLVLFCL